METTKSKLKYDYEAACNAYLKAFCEKHGYDYKSCVWVDWVGGIVKVCDYYFTMDTIRANIDTNAPKEEFIK